MISNKKEEEIINLSVIISYFLLFVLVLMTLFLTYNIFFRNNQKTMNTYEEYTGSIHVGVDTAPGDYQIDSNDSNSENYIYGIRSNEKKPFKHVAFEENDILQLKKGQHIIVYNVNLIPIDSVKQENTTKIVDEKIEEYTNEQQSEQVQDISRIESNEGTVKIKSDEYNTPYVISANGSEPYFEMYDSDYKLTKLEKVTYERLITISPSMATYIKFNDVQVTPLSDYVSTKGYSGEYFEDGVYVIGRSLESANYLLTARDNNCEYRIVEENIDVIEVPLNDCSDLPKTVELHDGTILEFHNANVEKVILDKGEKDTAQ